MPNNLVAEEQRLEQARLGVERWKKWGPYLAERQWGTVREDYSDNGNAWDYFSHDQAAHVLTAGAKTDSREFQTTNNFSASHRRCGMAEIQF
jgi:hypothetical protein